MNKLKLLAISCLITGPLTGCGSSDDDGQKVFQEEGSVDYYGPVITVNLDEQSVTAENGITYTFTAVSVDGTYVDAGATALDEIEGDATAAITMESDVDTTTPGEYTVIYTVSDSAGNTETAQRIVTVPDTIVPVITLSGGNVSVSQNSTYTDAGVTATDGFDGDVTDLISMVSTVDTSTLGVYTISYNVSDAAGNAAVEVVRMVTVEEYIPDFDAPVLTLTGNKVTNTEVGVPFTDEGATATDNIDDNAALTVLIDAASTVDTSVIGDYTITYNVSDAAGNAAEPVIRKVKVIPAIAGVDVIIDVMPQQTLQELKFGATMEFESDKLVERGEEEFIGAMINKFGIDTLRIPILASQPIDSPLYADVRTVAAEAKKQGMKIMATVSQSPDGLIANHNNWLAEDQKYTAIATCDDCPDNLYNIDLTAYAAYLDQYLADMAAAGAAVDYIAPFTHDAVSATDYQQLWAAMSGDDDGTVKRVGPESSGIDDAESTYAAVAAELDVAASNFYDEDNLTIDEQQTQWNALNATASSNSSPLWFTELHPFNQGVNQQNMLVNGIASMIPAIRAGAERIFFGKQLGTHLLWWQGGGTSGLRGDRVVDFVAGTKGNVVDSTLYSDLIRGVSFRNEDILHVMFTNNLDVPWYTPEELEADPTLADDPNRILATAAEVTLDPTIKRRHDRVVAIRLQEGETVAADIAVDIRLSGVNPLNDGVYHNRLIAAEDITVNDAKNVITFTLPGDNHAKVKITLTPAAAP